MKIKHIQLYFSQNNNRYMATKQQTYITMNPTTLDFVKSSSGDSAALTAHNEWSRATPRLKIKLFWTIILQQWEEMRRIRFVFSYV